MKAIISFHAIDSQPGPLSFAAASLDHLLAALREAETPILVLDDILSSSTDCGVALTFDDGIESLHRCALPLLRKHEAPAHLFLTTSYVAGNNRWPGQPDYARNYDMLDWEQIEELHGGGVAIEAHTATHPDLRTIDDDAVREEFVTCDEEIESRLGRKPRYFAYPYGRFDERSAALAAAHYEACFTTRLSYLPNRIDRSKVPRLDSHYLRSEWLMRNLSHPAAWLYMAGRNMVRQLLGRT